MALFFFCVLLQGIEVEGNTIGFALHFVSNFPSGLRLFFLLLLTSLFLLRARAGQQCGERCRWRRCLVVLISVVVLVWICVRGKARNEEALLKKKRATNSSTHLIDAWGSC